MVLAVAFMGGSPDVGRSSVEKDLDGFGMAPETFSE